MSFDHSSLKQLIRWFFGCAVWLVCSVSAIYSCVQPPIHLVTLAFIRGSNKEILNSQKYDFPTSFPEDCFDYGMDLQEAGVMETVTGIENTEDCQLVCQVSIIDTIWELFCYHYRETLVVEYLSWIDLDLGSSLGWWAAAVATYCPSRVVEHAKSKSTQPRYSTTRVTCTPPLCTRRQPKGASSSPTG